VVNTDDYARGMLSAMDIKSSDDLARWAKRKGLLGIYITFRPKTTFTKPAWQVVMPGGKTDSNTIAVNQGRKTFTYEDKAGKHLAEKRAKEWSDHTYGGGSAIGWYKIDGFGADFFPKAVVDELLRFLPDLVVYSKRQPSKPHKPKPRRK